MRCGAVQRILTQFQMKTLNIILGVGHNLSICYIHMNTHTHTHTHTHTSHQITPHHRFTPHHITKHRKCLRPQHITLQSIKTVYWSNDHTMSGTLVLGYLADTLGTTAVACPRVRKSAERWRLQLMMMSYKKKRIKTNNESCANANHRVYG